MFRSTASEQAAAETLTGRDAGRWVAPDGRLRVEYDRDVLRQVERRVVAGFRQFPHGGVETGGVLFGTRDGNVVRIRAFRALACQYASGPSFVLSEEDEQALALMMLEAVHDPALAGLEPVGWCHGRTRGDLRVTEHDRDVQSRFFPASWQVLLLLRPQVNQPTRAAFFVGAVDDVTAPPATFLIGGEEQGNPSAAVPAAAAGFAPGAGLGGALLSAAQSGTHRALDVLLPAPQPGRAPKSSVVLTLLATVVLLALALAGLFWKTLPVRDVTHLLLHLQDDGGQVRISWDRTAAPVRAATSGTLTILDDNQRTDIPLSLERLRSGSVSYARRSGRLQVGLILRQENALAHKEWVEMIAAPAGAGEAGSGGAATAEVPVPLPAVVKPIEEPAQIAEAERAPVEPAVAAPAPTAVETRAPETRVAAPPKAAPAPVEMALAPPPAVSLPLAASPSEIDPGFGGRGLALPGPPTEAAKSAPTSLAPVRTSGRVYWTGRLPRRGTVMLDSQGASLGKLSGQLPNAPVRVTAYSGEWTPEGLVLYTVAAQYARNGRIAAASGAGNRKVFYEFAPERAGDVAVLDPPRATNGNRLTLRADRRELSVIVLDWELLPTP